MDTTLPNTNSDEASNGDESTPGSDGSLIAVQLDTLKLGGVAPQAGDTVKFTVEGTVDSVDEQEGCAYVKPEKANGQPISDNQEQEQEPDEDDLQAKAEQADQDQGYQ
jgi:hypothetical protein